MAEGVGSTGSESRRPSCLCAYDRFHWLGELVAEVAEGVGGELVRGVGSTGSESRCRVESESRFQWLVEPSWRSPCGVPAEAKVVVLLKI